MHQNGSSRNVQYRSLYAALIGALFGTLVWALLIMLTGYEFGIVAWGVGVAVGGASALAGGRGNLNGACCVCLALAAIFAGKILAVRATEPEEIRTDFRAMLDLQERYTLDREAAREFAQLAPDADLRAFVVKYRYADEKPVESVTPQEVKGFHQKDAPTLRWMQAQNPSFNRWALEREDAYVRYMMGESSLIRWTLDDLTWIDGLFAFLGVGSAFHFGSGRGGKAGPAGPPAAQAPRA